MAESAEQEAASRSDTGATLVEYSLLIALFVIVCIGAISWLTDSASTSFEEESAAVADPKAGTIPPRPGTPGGPGGPGPGEPGSTTSTSSTSTTAPTTTTTAPTTTTTAPTTTTTAPPPVPQIGEVNCSFRSCTIPVDVPAGADVEWSSTSGDSGTGTPIRITFPNLVIGSADYTITVTAQPGGRTSTTVVRCSAFFITSCSPA